jgi:hypothetical protein
VSEDSQTLTLVFDLAGENKIVVVTKDGMGFYLDFLKKMGRVVSGLNLDGEFCSIGNGPDSVGLAYLTLEQKEWIVRNGSDLWVGSYLR